MMSASLATVTGVGNTGTLSYAVYSFQWAPTTPTPSTSAAIASVYPKTCLVTSVDVHYTVNTTFTAAQDVTFGLFRVNSYTVSATGGTTATFATTSSGRFDSNFGTTSFATSGAIRISTDGPLAGATGTIDRFPMKYWGGNTNTIGIAGGQTGNPWRPGDSMETQALWFRNNEGFVICPIVTLGAGGIVNLYVAVEWVEIVNKT
jgi:hypothetical protein